MLGTTRQQQAAVAACAAIGLVAALASIWEAWRVAAALTIVLLTAGVVVLLDVRRRTGGRAHGTNEQRVVEAVRSSQDELRAAIDALSNRTESTETVVSALEGQRRHREKQTKSLSMMLRNQTREIEALLQLYARVRSRQPMPQAGRWSVNPQGLLHLYTLVQQHRPSVVVELGSGASTVWLGYALAAIGSGRLISLEHLEEYVEDSMAMIGPHRADIAPTEVRWAPLTSVKLGDQEYLWYALDSLNDVDQIDMLLVDGPPGGTGPQARYPALPMLHDRLAEGAVIVLDDAMRGDEQLTLERWTHEVPGLVTESSPASRQTVLRYAPGRQEIDTDAADGPPVEGRKDTRQ